MKIINIIGVFLLAAFGVFVVYWNLTEFEHLKIYSGVVSGLTLIFWSMLLGVSQGKCYKGGAASIVGTANNRGRNTIKLYSPFSIGDRPRLNAKFIQKI